jgi:hypothetical protein
MPADTSTLDFVTAALDLDAAAEALAPFIERLDGLIALMDANDTLLETNDHGLADIKFLKFIFSGITGYVDVRLIYPQRDRMSFPPEFHIAIDDLFAVHDAGERTFFRYLPIYPQLHDEWIPATRQQFSMTLTKGFRVVCAEKFVLLRRCAALARGKAGLPAMKEAKVSYNYFGKVLNIAEKVTMSTTTTTIGTITGSNVNIASTLTDVTQAIGGLSNADQSTKEELTKLVAQLNAELQKLSTEKPDRKDQIEAVTVSTSELIEKAKQDKPNRTLLQGAIDAVKSIAKTLGDVAPAVLSTVTTIAGIIAKLHGL